MRGAANRRQPSASTRKSTLSGPLAVAAFDQHRARRRARAAFCAWPAHLVFVARERRIQQESGLVQIGREYIDRRRSVSAVHRCASARSNLSPELAAMTGSSTTLRGAIAIECCRDRLDRRRHSQHADLHRSDIKIGKHRVDLRRDEIGGHLVNAENASGVLRRQRRDRRSRHRPRARRKFSDPPARRAPPPESEPAIVERDRHAIILPRFASVASTMPRNARAAAAGSGVSDIAEITATPSAPAPMTAAALIASMPAMPAERQFGRAPMQGLDDAGETLRPDRGVLLLLRQRRIDAAGTHIVDQFDGRGLGLRHGFDRQADERIRSEQPPCILDRHIVRAEMNAVGSCGKRHIDTVIDDERHVERLKRRFDRPRLLDHGAGFDLLIAQLNERRAARGAKPRQFGEPAARRRARDRQWH